MKVVVVIDFPDIKDPNSEAADVAVAELEEDLKVTMTSYNWYIDDALGKEEDT